MVANRNMPLATEATPAAPIRTLSTTALEDLLSQHPCERVLLEFDGRLVDYHQDAHPYRVEPVETPQPETGRVAAPHVSIAGAGLPLVPNSGSPS